MMHSYGMMDSWFGMSGWGLPHLLFMALLAALLLFPVGVILKRLGYSPLWSVLLLVPILNIIGLWIVALGDVNTSNTEVKS